MNKLNSGILGVIVTASVVSYLGMNQGDLIPPALQGQVASSAGSSSSRSSSSFSIYRDCQNSSGGFGPCSSSSASSTPAVPTTDLFVSLAGPSIVQLTAGTPVLVTYSVRTTNGGATVARGTQMIFPLPENAVLSSSAGGLGCTTYQSNIICTMGDMGPGASIATTLSLNFSTPPSCTDVTFQPKAFVWSHTVETNLTNNIAGILTKTVCPPADLSVTKTGPGVAKIGDTVVYQVVVKNTGLGAANNVTVTDTIPAGFTYVSNLSSPFCVQNGSSIVCNNGNLASQQQTAMSLAFLISPSTVCGTVKNTVVTRTTSVDSNAANNTYTAPMNVTCPADLSLVIDGPPTQTFSNNTVDAVLARVTATPTKPVLVKNMYLAIQGSAGVMGLGDGSAFTQIDQVVRNVELRNVVTGGVMAATPLTDALSRVSTSAKTYQIYKVSNLAVSAAITWEVRADFIPNGPTNHPKANDTFRVLICVEPSNATPATGCTFSTLISPETQVYNLQATQSDNGSVVNILPGGTIAGNFHRISANSTLNVTVKNIGMSDTTVKNAKNINLFRFDARANEADDILFTSAVFNAQAGSLINAQNYALWVDTNADSIVDTILEKGINSSNNEIIFSNLVGGGYVIPKEKTVLFEVHADVAANLLNNTLQLKFYSEASSTYIQAETLSNGTSLIGNQTNGSCNITIPCQIIVTTSPSKIWNLVSQGNLFITRGIVSVRSRQLLGGTLGDEVLRLTLRGDTESIDVTGLQLSTWDSTGVSVDRLELYKVGSTTAFATATVGGCGNTPVLTVNPANGKAIRTFCALMQTQQLNIPMNQQVDIIVRPRMKTDDNGAISGESLKFWLPKNAGTVTARGLVSSNNLANNDGDNLLEGEVFVGVSSAAPSVDIVGNINQVVLSKIISVENANPDPTGTAVPMGISPVGQFKFTTSTNTNSKNGLNKSSINDVIFTMQVSNVAFDKNSFKLYNKADPTKKMPCNIVNDEGTSPYFIGCMNIPATGVISQIDPGSSQTFALEMSITNPELSAGSSLAIILKAFSDPFLGSLNKVYPTQSHISWQDKDTVSTAFYWVEHPETQIYSTQYSR